MEITTLIENVKSEEQPELKAENGLSLLIETNAAKILFDTGISGTFVSNANVLNKSLDDIDLAVISHGHYDHGGGLQRFLAINTSSKIYLSKNAMIKHYFKLVGPFRKYVGLDQKLITNNKDRFIFIDAYTELQHGAYLITDIENKYKSPHGNKKLFKQTNRSLLEDDFDHEIILVIKEDERLYCFTGCSHNGILNMIAAVDQHFSNSYEKIVIGGFHLMDPVTKKMGEPEKTVIDIGKRLSANPSISKIITGHCTGLDAYEILKTILGEKLVYARTGTQFQF